MLRKKQETVAIFVIERASDGANGNSTTCARGNANAQAWKRIRRNDPRPLSSQPLCGQNNWRLYLIWNGHCWSWAHNMRRSRLPR